MPNVRVTRARSVALACAFLLLAIVAFQRGMPRAAAAGSGFVRVNQVGYATDATKRAYLITSVDASSASFTVLGGSTSFSGPVGPDLGKWSKTFTHIYVLDFNDVTTPGSYTITVSGPVDATSPTFRIDGGTSLYSSSIANSLSFYQNERDGKQFIPSDLRTAAAHLNDADAMTYLTPKANASGRFSGDLSALGKRIDASGGWWDAGDYIKFVQTTSYTVDMLALGVRDFPDQMGAGSTTADFTQETKFGLRWLLHMWNDQTSTLYYQVGIGSGNAKTVGDHDIWRLPQEDDTYGGTDPRYRYIRNRPVFRAGAPGSPISPNLAGRLTAAFGVCYQLFNGTDPTFANRCLRAGEHIYDQADTNPSGNLLTVIPFSFYPEDEWQSDMELGATELSLALATGGASASLPHTDPRFYLREGAHWAHDYISGPFDATDTLNLYDVSGIAHYELYGAIGGARHVGEPRGHSEGARGRHRKGAQRRARAGGDRPVRVRVPVGELGHDDARRRARGDGKRIRRADGGIDLRSLWRPLAREYPRRERLGHVADRRRRHDVPALHATPGHEPGRITRWLAADPRRRGGRRTERHRVLRVAHEHEALPVRRIGRVRAVQRRGGQVPGQRRVVLDGRVRDRSDGNLAARVRETDGGYPMTTMGGVSMQRLHLRKRMSRSAIGAALVLGSFAAAYGAAPTPAHADAPTVIVTIGFDDGTIDQFAALDALNRYGMHATFFINTGPIIANDPDHMSQANLHTLADAGNEIAGHTVDHANIQPLSTADQRAEVCTDRNTLISWGFQPTNFAYPFGSWDADTEAVVAACGYNSARTVSGVSIHVGKNKLGETVPPVDPYATRTPPNPKKATKLSTMTQYVMNAEQAVADGSQTLWIQFVFHRYCDAHCGAYTVQPDKFEMLLQFLQGEAGKVSVETTAQVIGGPFNPAVTP